MKAPPKSYQEPAVDLRAKFDNILSSIKADKYSNEYEFQVELYNTFNDAHDGHFRFAPDLLSKAVGFRRPIQLVSVSRDGIEIPKIYIRGKSSPNNCRIIALIIRSEEVASVSNHTTNTVSAVSKINGEDAVDYLANLSQLGFLQDPDALYNNMFYELAMDAQYSDLRYTGYFAGAGRFGNNYPGANTTIAFENGTLAVFENYAEVFGNFAGVTDGPSFYQRFCSGPVQDPMADDDPDFSDDVGTAHMLRATPNAHGYPVPKVIASDQQVSGYFLDDDPSYSDVAVLSLLSFEPNFPSEFQAVIESFISSAKAAGKTRLVIDLSGNGGGIILSGYDAFRQFFPGIIQDGFSRFREHDAFKIMSEQISSLTADFSADTASSSEVFASQSILDYRDDLNLTNQNFLTFEDKFAPQNYNGDEFTNILRWNLSDPLLTTNTTWGLGMTITGYGARQNFTQPFAAADIVMVCFRFTLIDHLR